ncbi:MAG: hypothetical protein LGB57_04075 [Sulfurovum sp.]|nr:hypothetical protein [Sulfurovum sp.]
MMKKIIVKASIVSLFLGLFLVGCGSKKNLNVPKKDLTASKDKSPDNALVIKGEIPDKVSAEFNIDNILNVSSNIPYLHQNHTNYSEYGSSLRPTPTKNAAKKSIEWTIAAKTEYDAAQLAGHVRFMDQKLQEGVSPRAWDKLFLMETYMKVRQFYTTNIKQGGTTVIISKKASNNCAYNVIAASSDVISGHFFGKGDITQNYSSIAEEILKSSACSALRSDIEMYIQEKKQKEKKQKEKQDNSEQDSSKKHNRGQYTPPPPPPSQYNRGYYAPPPPPPSQYNRGYYAPPPPPPSQYNRGQYTPPPPPPNHYNRGQYTPPPPPPNQYNRGQYTPPPPPPNHYNRGQYAPPPPPPNQYNRGQSNPVPVQYSPNSTGVINNSN